MCLAIQFWQRPETAEHVFETMTPSDIRNMRDSPDAFVNLETLISETCRHLIHIREHSRSLSDREAARGKEVLNCIRVLTRILPFVYESDALRDWEHHFFWEPRQLSVTSAVANPRASVESPVVEHAPISTTSQIEPVRCLGPDLIDSLLDLAFWSGFTLPNNHDGENGPTYGFWQSGIAYDRRLDTSNEFESRRTEIMQLLLTLESKAIYVTTGELALCPCLALANPTCP